ncbi:MAG: CinA family protein [Armatimonadota bacterium]
MFKKSAELLIKNKLTISIAESLTGGLICNTITDIPGSSDYFLGGIIAYSNSLKTKLLKIKKDYLKKYGAVSEVAARGMAKSVKDITGSDVALAVTGIAGPSGGMAKKPVGLVYIAVCCKKKTQVCRYIFKGGRLSVKKQTLKKSVELLEKVLSD